MAVERVNFRTSNKDHEIGSGFGVIERGIETISLTSPITYKEGFQDEYVKAIKEGYYPVIVANHTSHADGILIAPLANILTGVNNDIARTQDPFQGFMLPLSQSLDNGEQGFLKHQFYVKSRPVLSELHLYPVLTATKNDREKRGLSKNTEEFSSDLKAGIKNNYGIAVFPEGSVTGGRRNEYGKLNGMQPFAEDGLALVILNAKRYRKSPVAFIPVGIDGGYKIFNPQTGLPSKSAVRYGLGFGNLPETAKLTVGKPIKSNAEPLDSLVKTKQWEEIDKVIGKNIAQLIPDELRGIYA